MNSNIDSIIVQSEEQKISKKGPKIFLSYSKFSYVQQRKKGCEKTELLVKIIARNVLDNRQEKFDCPIRQRIIQMQSVKLGVQNICLVKNELTDSIANSAAIFSF